MDDERHNLSLEKLLDIGLYNRWGEMPRSTPEERAMRYSAVCTSMLADRVEDLEEGNESSTKKFAEVEGSMGSSPYDFFGKTRRTSPIVEKNFFWVLKP